MLDSFNLTGLPKLPKGQVDISVKFRVEFDGTLNVTAFDRSKGEGGVSRLLLSHRGAKLDFLRHTLCPVDPEHRLVHVRDL